MRIGRRFALSGSALAMVGLAGGCGFRPLYGRMGDGTAMPEQLRQVDVALIPDRAGQLLREELQRRLQGESGSGSKSYLLTVTYNVSDQGVATEFTTSAQTRVRVIGEAHWSLISIRGEAHEIASGWAKSNDGANLIDVQYFYSDLQHENVVRRISTDISQKIVTDIAAYFQNMKKSG
ncbi:MAG: LPS assembly lipoprotein LptE [Acetobacteraceae bacterium]|nr:LPS assembly lipoprotein LptE [Acetobacteraceae bacterium]